MEGLSSEQKIQVQGALTTMSQLPVTAVVHVSLAFGFALLLGHFYSIGYLPSFSVSSLLTVLYAVGIIGFAISALICLQVLIPAIFWLLTVTQSDFNERIFMRYKQSDGKQQRRFVPKTLILNYYSSYIFYVPFALYLIDWNTAATVVALLSSVIIFVSMNLLAINARYRFPMMRFKKRGNISFRFRVFLDVLWPGLSPAILSLTGAILVISNYELDGSPFSIFYSLFTGVTLFAIATMTNLMVILSYLARHRLKEGLRYSVAMMAIFLVLLCFLTNSWSRLPNHIVQHLRLGAISNARLLVTKEGCELARQALPSTVCQPQGTTLLTSMTVLSNIGDALFLEANQDQGAVRFTLPRSMLVSLVTDAKPNSK